MGYVRINDIRVDQGLEKRLPNPPDEELSQLIDDIKCRGIVVDLLVTRDNLLLDGHRRLRAAREAGMERVPVKVVDASGHTCWESAVALAVNLHRRHLNVAQRANLGSSLLRIERERAKERQARGQVKGGQTGGRGRRKKLVANGAPQANPRQRSTDRVAEKVGVSRKTLERVEKVKRVAPELSRRMLDGDISVAAAYRIAKLDEAKKAREKQGAELHREGEISDLAAALGRYRTVHLDLQRFRSEATGMAAGSVQALSMFPLRDLAHPNGCHFWIWAPWSALRKGTFHRLLRRWDLRWAGEMVWDWHVHGTERRFGERLEMLVLAVSGRPRLLVDEVTTLVQQRPPEAQKRPERIYSIIEDLCLGPRIELLSELDRPGWDFWAGISEGVPLPSWDRRSSQKTRNS